jgi:hypothetical protein
MILSRIRETVNKIPISGKGLLFIFVWFFVVGNTWSYISFHSVSLIFGRTGAMEYSGDAALVLLVLMWIFCLVISWAGLRPKI